MSVKTNWTVIHNAVGYMVVEGVSRGARKLCSDSEHQYYYKSFTHKRSFICGYNSEAMRHAELIGRSPGSFTSDLVVFPRKASKRTRDAMERVNTLFDFEE